MVKIAAKTKTEYLALAEQCERRARERPDEAAAYHSMAVTWRHLAAARKQELTSENYFSRK